jgi:hypothetical protein
MIATLAAIVLGIFLILEMGQPFDGPLQISGTPLRNALNPLTAAPR